MSRPTNAVVAAALVAGVAYAGLAVKARFNENRRCCAMPFGRNAAYSLREALGLTTSFSQFGQDKWVSEVVFPGVTNGFFLDVGSADGTVGSNSRLLEDLGWTGLCVDPFPKYMDDRTCRMFTEVVSNEAGQTVSFRQAGDIGGIDHTLGTWKDKARESPLVTFRTVTLADVLARGQAPRFIHYLSLDIEGAELLALEGFPFDRYQLGALTIEHNFEEPKRGRIKALLESHGYRRAHQSTLDDFYLGAGR